MESGDKDWATKYLLDPLNAPEPSQEDGPGGSIRPGVTAAPVKQSTPTRSSTVGRRLSKTNPFLKSPISETSTTEIRRSASLNNHGPSESYPSPPSSARMSTPPAAFKQAPHSPMSPRSPSHRQGAFGSDGSHSNSPKEGGHRRRGSSLSERYPGDKSHRPLDTLAKEKHIADRARHSTRKHHIQPDTIDSLDRTGAGPYHHGGPYDATLIARNNFTDSTKSPLAALEDSNAEALKATPKEKILDSVRGHRPLDGVAAFAPGNADRFGNVYDYREGENMMVDVGPEGGAYKRWPGMQYHPDDIKGKGEPSYSIEKALKDHKISDGDRQTYANGESGMELRTRHRSSSGAVAPTVDRTGWDDDAAPGIGRSASLSKRLSGGLKKRFGSIKRNHHGEGSG